MSLTMTPIRPPRPNVPPAELLQKYRDNGGYPVDRVAAAWTTPEGDTVIELDGGVRCRIVEPSNPDGAGLSGLLQEPHPRGYSSQLPQFTPRSAAAQGDPWSLEDIAWVAGKRIVPSMGTAAADGWGGHAAWLREGGDNDTPVRAFALWRAEARRLRDQQTMEAGITMALAARRSQLCARLRQEIIACGWLSNEALKELDAL